jgi:hypothetical protein
VWDDKPTPQTTNTKTPQPIYSIQARVGKNGWAHLHENGKPMFFDKETDRDDALKELLNG